MINVNNCINVSHFQHCLQLKQYHFPVCFCLGMFMHLAWNHSWHLSQKPLAILLDVDKHKNVCYKTRLDSPLFCRLVLFFVQRARAWHLMLLTLNSWWLPLLMPLTCVLMLIHLQDCFTKLKILKYEKKTSGGSRIAESNSSTSFWLQNLLERQAASDLFQHVSLEQSIDGHTNFSDIGSLCHL